MFIERIDVGRFGSLQDVTIDGLGPGVQVLHGTNETGKTRSSNSSGPCSSDSKGCFVAVCSTRSGPAMAGSSCMAARTAVASPWNGGTKARTSPRSRGPATRTA